MPSDTRTLVLQSCRHCGAGAPTEVHFCPQCERILTLTRHGDYFSFFGLPRKLVVDLADLDVRFRRLSRQFHPDYFYTASGQERAGEPRARVVPERRVSRAAAAARSRGVPAEARGDAERRPAPGRARAAGGRARRDVRAERGARRDSGGSRGGRLAASRSARGSARPGGRSRSGRPARRRSWRRCSSGGTSRRTSRRRATCGAPRSTRSGVCCRNGATSRT